MRAPETIVCVDCGGTCHLLAHPETEFDPGDPVAYRCADCVDRWDLVMPDDEAVSYTHLTLPTNREV